MPTEFVKKIVFSLTYNARLEQIFEIVIFGFVICIIAWFDFVDVNSATAIEPSTPTAISLETLFRKASLQQGSTGPPDAQGLPKATPLSR